MNATDFQVEAQGVSFWLRVHPRSARERLTRNPSGELRLEVYAPPAEGEANEACVRYFARALRLPQASVAIASGAKARRKLIRITGRSGEEIARNLQKLTESGKNR